VSKYFMLMPVEGINTTIVPMAYATDAGGAVADDTPGIYRAAQRTRHVGGVDRLSGPRTVLSPSSM
jgi:hypothetical protein